MIPDKEDTWKKIRARILKRDHYRCRVLGCRIEGARNLSIHHILPRQDGGGDNDENLVALCNRHHDEIESAGLRLLILIENWQDIHADYIAPPQIALDAANIQRRRAASEPRDATAWLKLQEDYEDEPEPEKTKETPEPPAAVSSARNAVKLPPIGQEEMRQALSGEIPPIGRPISLTNLGKRLGPFRHGTFAGIPFTRQAVYLYQTKPEKQSNHFISAFRSWKAAEIIRQEEIRVRFDGLNVDDIIGEQGYIVQLGHGPAKALLVIGDLPPGTLILTDSPIPATVTCRAEIAVCPCGQHFVKRTPRHRWCSPDCPARQVSK